MMLGRLGTTELAIIFIAVFFYCLPSLLAWYRSHHNVLAITLLNLLLGWTIIGWLAALIWAAMNPPPRA